jgi:hypothetical protein
MSATLEHDGEREMPGEEVSDIVGFINPHISTTLVAHLANHLAASGFVLPHHINLDMPWSFSPPGDQSITQSEPP